MTLINALKMRDPEFLRQLAMYFPPGKAIPPLGDPPAELDGGTGPLEAPMGRGPSVEPMIDRPSLVERFLKQREPQGNGLPSVADMPPAKNPIIPMDWKTPRGQQAVPQYREVQPSEQIDPQSDEEDAGPKSLPPVAKQLHGMDDFRDKMRRIGGVPGAVGEYAAPAFEHAQNMKPEDWVLLALSGAAGAGLQYAGSHMLGKWKDHNLFKAAVRKDFVRPGETYDLLREQWRPETKPDIAKLFKDVRAQEKAGALYHEGGEWRWGDKAFRHAPDSPVFPKPLPERPPSTNPLEAPFVGETPPPEGLFGPSELYGIKQPKTQQQPTPPVAQPEAIQAKPSDFDLQRSATENWAQRFQREQMEKHIRAIAAEEAAKARQPAQQIFHGPQQPATAPQFPQPEMPFTRRPQTMAGDIEALNRRAPTAFDPEMDFVNEYFRKVLREPHAPQQPAIQPERTPRQYTPQEAAQLGKTRMRDLVGDKAAVTDEMQGILGKAFGDLPAQAKAALASGLVTDENEAALLRKAANGQPLGSEELGRVKEIHGRLDTGAIQGGNSAGPSVQPFQAGGTDPDVRGVLLPSGVAAGQPPEGGPAAGAGGRSLAEAQEEAKALGMSAPHFRKNLAKLEEDIRAHKILSRRAGGGGTALGRRSFNRLPGTPPWADPYAPESYSPLDYFTSQLPKSYQYRSNFGGVLPPMAGGGWRGGEGVPPWRAGMKLPDVNRQQIDAMNRGGGEELFTKDSAQRLQSTVPSDKARPVTAEGETRWLPESMKPEAPRPNSPGVSAAEAARTLPRMNPRTGTVTPFSPAAEKTGAVLGRGVKYVNPIMEAAFGAEAAHKVITHPEGFLPWLGEQAVGIPDAVLDSGSRLLDFINNPQKPAGHTGKVTRAYQGAREFVGEGLSRPFRELEQKQRDNSYLERYRPAPFTARWFSDPTGEKAWQEAVRNSPERKDEQQQRDERADQIRNEYRFSAAKPGYEAEQNAHLARLKQQAETEKRAAIHAEVNTPESGDEKEARLRSELERHNDTIKNLEEHLRRNPGDEISTKQLRLFRKFRDELLNRGSSSAPRRSLTERFLAQYAA